MALRSLTTLTFLKLAMALALAAWISIWILRPTQLWKRSWHVAEDQASITFLGDSGLNIVVYCFPVLAVATLGYIYLHLSPKEEKSRNGRGLFTRLRSTPLVVCSPFGILSGGEILVIGLFISFLLWTYCSNVATDFKKLTPYKFLKLNRLQLKVMHMGVRFGSLSEACLALLFLPILRGMSIIRIIGIEFDAAVNYHVWIANGMMLFSALHGITIMSVWAANGRLLIEVKEWDRTGRVNIAGAITLAVGVIIWLTSLPQIRRKKFQLFYLTHHLYIIFILFFLLHAGDRHFYLVLSGIMLFSLDKILRIQQSQKTTSLISARILPCKAVELTLPKHSAARYTPGCTIFVKIPRVSKIHWHPFSITSSCSMASDKLSILVKCQGQWTNDLHNMINSIDQESGTLADIQIAIEGPYGPESIIYRRYSSLVLVAGGSGISPFLSILQDVASSNVNKTTCPIKIQLIYTVKKLQDLSMLSAISPLLLNETGELGHVKLKLFVTREDGPPISAREVLQKFSHLKTLTLNNTKPGDVLRNSEGLIWRAAITGLMFLIFLAFIIILNPIFLPHGRRSVRKKSPSWISDLLVLCSFLISISSCTVATILLRLRKPADRKLGYPIKYEKPADTTEWQKHHAPAENYLVEFGNRPNLADAISEFLDESGESDIGVFVCGPYAMKESVALFCRKYSRNIRGNEKKLKSCLSFHPISFSL